MIKETDNTSSVLQELKDKIGLGLKLTGEICEGYAKISTKMGGRCPVDTGLLKNSISYTVKENSGSTRSAISDDGSKSISYTMPTVDDYTVIIGTAVEYAPCQESKHGFLVHSLSDHKSEVKAAFETAFKTP